MSTKVYSLFWLILLLAAVFTYFAGAFTGLVLIAFGFVSIALVFMGMISVIPVWMSHSPNLEIPQPAEPPVRTVDLKTRSGAISPAPLRNSPVH